MLSSEDSCVAGRIGRFLASPWALLLALVLAFFLNSGSLPLTDVDEGAFSEATREMRASGNWISPTLNGRPRHDKPILIYWAQAASVALLGEREIGFRLPSLLAALAWLASLYVFCRRQLGHDVAMRACLVMVLSVQVGVIAKAAIADALLNLFICVSLFFVYAYLQACRQAMSSPSRQSALLLGLYASIGLGFLTKGPVAVFFPLVIGAGFALSTGALRPFLRGLFYGWGWLLFALIVVPWHVLVYLDQGDAFFRGFYLKHNVDRYASTFEGHGGRWWYYLVVLPIVLMPFTGWLLTVLPKLWRAWRGEGMGAGRRPATENALLDRFLGLWFAVVFVFFTFSGTQLPHYLLYGCTPLFILLARYPVDRERRVMAYLPLLLFAVLLAALPWLIDVAGPQTRRVYEQTVLQGLSQAFDPLLRGLLCLLPVLVLLLFAWRRVPAWQGLVLSGVLLVGVLQGMLLPRILSVTQGPVGQLAVFARTLPGDALVSYRVYLPSFSVYRQAVTPVRTPKEGEYVLTREDKLPDLRAEIAPLQMVEVERAAFLLIGQVRSPAGPSGQTTQ